MRDHGTSDHGGPNQGQGGLPGHCWRGLSMSARWLRRRPTTTSPSAVTPMLSSALTPSMLLGPPCTSQHAGCLTAVHSVDATECRHQAAAGLRRSLRAVPRTASFCLRRRQTLPSGLRRRGRKACPSRHGARPALRLACPSRPTMRPSALPGRRLATAVAGLRKASELFKHSCTNDS